MLVIMILFIIIQYAGYNDTNSSIQQFGSLDITFWYLNNINSTVSLLHYTAGCFVHNQYQIITWHTHKPGYFCTQSALNHNMAYTQTRNAFWGCFLHTIKRLALHQSWRQKTTKMSAIATLLTHHATL